MFFCSCSLYLWERVRVRVLGHARPSPPPLSQRERGIRSVLHCFQENVFQRISLVTEPPNLYLIVRGQPINVTNLSSALQNDLQSILAGNRALTSERVNRAGKLFEFAARFEHEKLLVGFALFL